MNKHTQGPWVVGRGATVYGADGYEIADAAQVPHLHASHTGADGHWGAAKQKGGSMNRLPNDIARCDGHYIELDGCREIFDRKVELISSNCLNCLRRTAPRPDPYWNMEPPTFEGKCPKKIEPKENNGN